ncbi:hypothetical protein NDU88_001654 [Pleurodeles waltl]|uniref:Uncharacterized protein n=1 Tax=Pleurodeles waltl TaxID=8319 RepID=A0AAV7WM63_PLEWA|nr:hypothetical protein NDU88_001654 [Pleurodeles waltl]
MLALRTRQRGEVDQTIEMNEVDQTIEMIERGDGTRATAPEDIINIFQEYYTKLYKTDVKAADSLVSDFFRTGEFDYLGDGEIELIERVYDLAGWPTLR